MGKATHHVGDGLKAGVSAMLQAAVRQKLSMSKAPNADVR